MALHEQSVGKTDEWYTPPHVFEALGEQFDLDVAHPAVVLPWVPANRVFTGRSLEREWHGFVWMNPPFGGRNGITPWLTKFMTHPGGGVALTPDRTSAPWWQQFAPQADALLFVAPKLKFIGADGQPGRSPAQGTTLMAKGARAVHALERAQVRGLGLVLKP